MNLTPYIGIPFVPFGRTFDGCDCWGLVRLFYLRELGILLPSYTKDYNSPADGAAVQQIINHHKNTWHKVIDPEIGDVILIRTKEFLSHVAVVVNTTQGLMLHTTIGVDSCLERFATPIYTARIEGFYRYARSNS